MKLFPRLFVRLRPMRLRRGFTLIELLIVIVIIGILAVGLVPKIIDAPRKARDTVKKKDIGAIQVALESYYADHNDYPSPVTDGRTPPELASYFQGGKIPKPDQDPSGDYYYHHDTTSGHNCYLVGTVMESPTAGNATALPATHTCDVIAQLKAGDGASYFIAGGSY